MSTISETAALRRAPASAAGAACLLLLTACAGNGEGLDASGRPADDDGGGGVLTPDLASIQSNVFTPLCTQCHAGASAPQGLRLDAGNSYGALVGVPSSEVPGVLRVRPGDPERSYLVQKLEGRASVGERMPLGLPALPNDTILVIRQWILDGALRGSETGGDTLRVDTVSVSASTIAVAFNRAVDSTLIDEATVRLEPLDADVAPGVEVPTRVAASPVNAALLLVRSQGPLSPGQYRLTLRGSEPVALADWSGRVLDGDGDGTAGGDFELLLTVGAMP